ncbi:tetratricopeptide (TPR) repeat protein [Achromobacter deleyi]|uniref:tetratricopeptide repeat protein n=1 Tax=Achromobacter deleyi TaxID=1353891 RepID=UPI00285D754B|nr:tetratricopeptide repeat protein [Achromobacter deleyi]MDR6602099.1 tetratricopeptide (TPR) repeat protein [Achromobacter deleyi]
MTTPTLSLPFLDQYAQALEEGDAERALGILRQAHEDHPESGQTLALLAAQYMQSGSPDAAEAAFVGALQLDPALTTARFQLGLLQYTSGRPQTAFQTWQPLELLGEAHYLVHFKRAFATLAIDAFDDTLLLLNKGIAVNHENAPLNHDMRMLAGQIDAMRGNASDAPSAQQDEAATQFVLASYKQNL